MTNDQKEVIELKSLADDYAHVYAFVGDDSMPIARKRLHDAIDAFVSAIKEQMISEGWSQCAKGQGETQFRTQAEAVRTQDRESGSMCNCVDCAPSGADCGCHQGPEKCHYCKIVGLQEQVDQEQKKVAMLHDAAQIARTKIRYMLEHGEWYSPEVALQQLDSALSATKQSTDAFIAEVKAEALKKFRQSQLLEGTIPVSTFWIKQELRKAENELRQSAAQHEFMKCPACSWTDSKKSIVSARFDFPCPRCGKHTISEFIPVIDQSADADTERKEGGE